jgi:hypothetical protein
MAVPTSELVDTGDGEAAGAGSYEEALDAFLERSGLADGPADVPAIFHAVRNLAYHSSGDRTPEAVLRTGRGACTAKHILLRDLLRRRGEVADVEIVAGDFAAAVPEVESMPAALRRWVREGGIRDFHCYAVWRGAKGELKLDATWPDGLATYGFTINAGWAGEGDTALAIEPVSVKARVEDVIGRKERLLATLSQDAAANRRAFLGLLSTWLDEVN